MPSAKPFDVFLCHNSADKPFVRKIASALESMGIRCWIDEDELQVGVRWYPALFEELTRIKTMAVFIGTDGVGPYQAVEVEKAMRLAVERGIPVIPVLLPKYRSDKPELPPFVADCVNSFNHVDFALGNTIAMKRLIAGITGRAPGSIVTNDLLLLLDTPDVQTMKMSDNGFSVNWVMIHFLGFISVVACKHVSRIPGFGEKAVWQYVIASIAVIVAISLVVAGGRLLKGHLIAPDWSGGSAGGCVGVGAAILLVQATNAHEGVANFAGAGTAAGTGIVCGMIAGAIPGAIGGALAGLGAFVGALMTPEMQGLTENTGSNLNQSVLIVVSLFGAGCWFYFLSRVIRMLAQNHIRVRRQIAQLFNDLG